MKWMESLAILLSSKFYDASLWEIEMSSNITCSILTQAFSISSIVDADVELAAQLIKKESLFPTLTQTLQRPQTSVKYNMVFL